MPLSILIAAQSPIPVYRQIVDQVCAAVVAGRLVENEAMPSVRLLADELDLNPNTVARAYRELIREGSIESHSTRGSFVANRRQVHTRLERRRRLRPALNSLVSEALRLGFSPDEIVAQVAGMAEELSQTRAKKRRGRS